MDNPTERDAENAQRPLNKLQGTKDKIASIISDDLENIMDYKRLVTAWPVFTEWFDELTHSESSRAERIIAEYEANEAGLHRQHESTHYGLGSVI